MNFEFKSTFIYTSAAFSRKGICDLLRSIDHAFWVTSVNILALVITASLYLQNYLIPGTYGSGPRGDTWVDALLTLARIWAITTSYSLLRLVYICNSARVSRIVSSVRAHIRQTMNQSHELIPIIALQGILLTNLILKEPRRSGRYTTALNPLTHINFIITI
jgi:hypothetical protein